MKLRITQEGFNTYSGQMGTVFFKDGLSLADVRPVDALRMAAQFLCEWENGAPATVTQSMLDHSNSTLASYGEQMNADQAKGMELNANQAQESNNGEVAAAAVVEVKIHSRADLEAIVDLAGIKGLRAIADPLGLKNNSVAGLIDDILKKQG